MKRLLFACVLIVGMGSLMQASALKKYLPSVSLPLSLNSFKTPEMIQTTINKITSLFSALSPNSLQNIIKNQTAELSKNMKALQQGYSRILALKIGKNITLATAAALALGVEAGGVAAGVYFGGKAIGEKFAPQLVPVPETFGQ